MAQNFCHDDFNNMRLTTAQQMNQFYHGSVQTHKGEGESLLEFQTSKMAQEECHLKRPQSERKK